MSDREFRGVWVPKEIWLAQDLTILDKAIMVEIDSLDKDEIGCWAGNPHFAKMFGCTERKVSDSVSKLIKKGYVKVLRYDGRKRFLRSCMKVAFEPPIDSFQSDTNKFSTLPDETFQSDSRDVPQRNTYRNTVSINISSTDDIPDGFDAFWKEYPRHDGKADAIKAWKSLNPGKQLQDTIIKDVQRRMRDGGAWFKSEKRFIKMAASYLRGRRWEDETETPRRDEGDYLPFTQPPPVPPEERKAMHEALRNGTFFQKYGTDKHV